MSRIKRTTRFGRVEHILGSESDILNSAIEGEAAYRTWEGLEDADWDVEDVDSVENVSEDRYLIYPEEKYFMCEIDADRGVIHCLCDG